MAANLALALAANLKAHEWTNRTNLDTTDFSNVAGKYLLDIVWISTYKTTRLHKI